MKHFRQFVAGFVVAFLLGLMIAAAPAAPNLINPNNVTWLQLLDTPNAYTDKAYQVPNVNTGETGLEFSDAVYVDDDFSLEVATGDSYMPAFNVLGSTSVAYTGRAGIGLDTNAALTQGFYIGANFEDESEDFFIYDLYDTALRLMIDSAGNVGIGEPPESKLHTTGVFGIRRGTTDWVTNDHNSKFYCTENAGAYPFNIAGNLVIQPRTSYPSDIVLATGSPNPVRRLVVTGGTGYVGIFDATPTYHLDVNGDARTTGNMYVNDLLGIGENEPEADIHVRLNGQIFQGNIDDANSDDVVIGSNSDEGGYMVWTDYNVPGAGYTIFNGGAAGPDLGVWVSAISKCSANDDVQHHEAFLVPGESMQIYFHDGTGDPQRCEFVLYLTDDSPPEMYIEHPVVFLYSARVSLLMHWLN